MRKCPNLTFSKEEKSIPQLWIGESAILNKKKLKKKFDFLRISINFVFPFGTLIYKIIAPNNPTSSNCDNLMKFSGSDKKSH